MAEAAGRAREVAGRCSADAARLIPAPLLQWRSSEVTPVTTLPDGVHVLELFHGPTFAFKDVALQFLGNLFEHLLQQRRAQGLPHTITVVGATSGDTGSSAIYGLRGKRGVEVAKPPRGSTPPPSLLLF